MVDIYERALKYIVSVNDISEDELKLNLKISDEEVNSVMEILELSAIIEPFIGSNRRNVISHCFETNKELILDALEFQASMNSPSVSLSDRIIEFLNSHPEKKFSVKDITAMINHFEIDTVRKECEYLYYNETIGRDGNHKYFLLVK